MPFLDSLESAEDLLVPFLAESALFLKGNGTFAFTFTGLGGKNAGRDIVGPLDGAERSSSSPSSGEEVACRFEALIRDGDLEAILLRRLGAMSSSPPRKADLKFMVVAEQN
jgi:hypothetical protein